MSPDNGSLNLKINYFSRPILAGVFSFVFLLILGSYLLFQRYQIISESEERAMVNVMAEVKQNLNRLLKDSYSVALSMSFLINEEGEIENFEEEAPLLMQEYPVVDVIQLVPNGVIKEVYPYEGNEAVIDYDILNDPKTRAEALKAIVNKRMYFAGPFELKQGGTAVVGRLPVYKRGEFWGFSAVIITLQNLLEQAQLEQLAGEKYLFQFSKIDFRTQQEKFFLQNDIEKEHQISETIVLPDGDWKFYIALKNPKEVFYELVPMAFFMVLLAGWLSYMIILLFKQPIKLRQLVTSQAGELAASELKFRTIFNQAAIGMVQVETATGRFLETNKRFRELCGYTAAELKKMNFKDISDPSEIDRNVALMNQLLNGEIQEYSLEKSLIQKSGKILWINLSVSPLWKKNSPGTTHISIIVDITERVEAQKELMQKERRYRALVENGAEIVTIFSKEGWTLYSSPSGEKLSGYTEAEIKSINLGSLVHPDDYKGFQEQLQTAIQNPKQPVFGDPVRLINKAGEWRWAESTITNLLGDPNINGIVGNFRDISEKKEAELNLNKSYQMVMEQNRRLLNFSYIVSHNLRSHSSNIQAILNLYNTTDNTEERANYIGLLFKVGDALNETLDDLNEVVSISANLDLNVQQLNINEYLDKTLDLIEVQIQEKAAVIERQVPDSMVVEFNPAYLESVLLNFLTNAIRYREQERPLRISITGVQENGSWVLMIKDNGIGIDLDRHADKLFGLYKTFTRSATARGVGLFITKNQINAMGGTVSVESEVGVGTTFKVFFK